MGNGRNWRSHHKLEELADSLEIGLEWKLAINPNYAWDWNFWIHWNGEFIANLKLEELAKSLGIVTGESLETSN
jgi:hypothetical protein